MTSRCLTPWWRTWPDAGRSYDAPGGVEPTRLLDWQSPAIHRLAVEAGHNVPADDPRALILRAHSLIAGRIRPVYSLEEAQPASRTLRLGRGSCSQRLAVLEAVARGAGIATRVRGLVIDGSFWYPRFPRLRFAVPDAVLLAWPEFRIGEAWVDASELFGAVGSQCDSRAFSNDGEETLFDALSRSAVDWDGVCSSCDLSRHVLRDLGRYDSRDDLFRTHGQTLCWPARILGGPVLGRWSAGAHVASA